ncbi:hypothetical protein LUZ60_007031 [Juncus effusus]|nr:hypothetical protein LUZ60_007031 [Juncus effusus]
MPLLCFKADIEKAFDTVSWDFIIKVFEQRGIRGMWLEWIKAYVLKGSTKIILNGKPGKSIHMRRGVRQGDPLSPHLFIVAIDTLARVAENLSSINFIEKPFLNSHISLYYADDSVFLIKPEVQQVQRLKMMLKSFENSSGLKINFEKSEFTIIPENHPASNEISSELGCPQASMPIRYLGYPLHFKKPMKRDYRNLIENFGKKLQGWQGTNLSIGGRLVLINSVLSSLSVYYLSVFKFPKWVIKEMDKIRQNFLWKGNKEKGYNLINWKKVCRPKSGGGLGVLNLEIFNNAMLLKWIWKYFSENHGLQWKTLVYKLCLEGGEVIKNSADSYFWSEIKKLMPFFLVSTEFVLGNGASASFWHSNWGVGVISHNMPSLYSHAEIIRDSIKWRWTENGRFSTHNAYFVLSLGVHTSHKLTTIWSVKVPLKMKVFIWLFKQNRVLTQDNLRRRGMIIINRCSLCCNQLETTQHLAGECLYVQYHWSKLCSKLREIKSTDPFHLVFTYASEGMGGDPLRQIAFLFMFCVWRQRCRKVFEEERVLEVDLVEEVLDELKLIRSVEKRKREELIAMAAQEQGSEEIERERD